MKRYRVKTYACGIAGDRHKAWDTQKRKYVDLKTYRSESQAQARVDELNEQDVGT